MLGFAATLDHVSPGVSQIENASGTLYGGVRGRGNRSTSNQVLLSAFSWLAAEAFVVDFKRRRICSRSAS